MPTRQRKKTLGPGGLPGSRVKGLDLRHAQA